jgi:hypothetical protein
VLCGCAGVEPRFMPTLSELEVHTDHSPGAHMLVSLRAVKADEEHHLPAGLEARIRLDDESSGVARIEPGSLELLASDLGSFPAPSVDPPEGLTVQPGQHATLVARFPYPPDEDARAPLLRAVNLRWRVQLGSSSFVRTVTFDRSQRELAYVYAPPPYYGSFDESWWWGPSVFIERDVRVPGGRRHDRDRS